MAEEEPSLSRMDNSFTRTATMRPVGVAGGRVIEMEHDSMPNPYPLNKVPTISESKLQENLEEVQELHDIRNLNVKEGEEVIRVQKPERFENFLMRRPAYEKRESDVNLKRKVGEGVLVHPTNRRMVMEDERDGEIVEYALKRGQTKMDSCSLKQRQDREGGKLSRKTFENRTKLSGPSNLSSTSIAPLHTSSEVPLIQTKGGPRDAFCGIGYELDGRDWSTKERLFTGQPLAFNDGRRNFLQYQDSSFDLPTYFLILFFNF